MKVELAGHYGLGRLVRASMPTIAMMIITSVYSIVDGFFVSNYAGSTAFASMNLVWPILALISAVGLMIGTGGSALVSKTLGEGDVRRANETFTLLIRTAIIIGIAITAVVFIFMERLTIALGAEGDMIPRATMYGRIVILAMPAFILQMAFQSFYMTAEIPTFGTMMSILSGCINIALDALFVVAFKWGLSGAAVATAISLFVGGILPLWYFSSGRNTTQLKLLRTCGTNWKAIGQSCTNGMSEYVGNIALNIVSIAYNLQLMKYIGENGVSAYGIIMYVGFIFSAVFIGYNLCVSQVIAFNFGAGNRDELRSLLTKSILLTGIGGIVLTALAEISAPTLARIFVGYDADLCELAIRAIRIYMLSFILCGFNMFCSAWFTALSNGLVSAAAAFTRTLIFELGAVMVVPAIIGIDGIWVSVSIAETLALIMSAALIFAYRKRYLIDPSEKILKK